MKELVLTSTITGAIAFERLCGLISNKGKLNLKYSEIPHKFVVREESVWYYPIHDICGYCSGILVPTDIPEGKLLCDILSLLVVDNTQDTTIYMALDRYHIRPSAGSLLNNTVNDIRDYIVKLPPADEYLSLKYIIIETKDDKITLSKNYRVSDKKRIFFPFHSINPVLGSKIQEFYRNIDKSIIISEQEKIKIILDNTIQYLDGIKTVNMYTHTLNGYYVNSTDIVNKTTVPNVKFNKLFDFANKNGFKLDHTITHDDVNLINLVDKDLIT